jgi:Uma2 family endonuclease
MGAMSPAPVGDAWTIADLDALPDEGARYEIVDGMLLVNPPPKPGHQLAAYELAKVLEAAAPFECLVVPGPARVTLGDDTALEPDLSVWWRRDLVDDELLGVPLLVVEVLSPSTRSKDLVLKRDVYARIGIPSYWVLDHREPSLLALDLRDEGYEEVSRATGDAVLSVSHPFAFSVRPSDLG